MDWETIRKNALQFKKNWKDAKGNEKSEAQWFMEDFFKVFGIGREEYICEHEVKRFDGSKGYIDGYLKGKLIIEMKSAFVSKDKKMQDAFDQANEYVNCLDNEDEIPRYILVCNFKKFILYDLDENSNSDRISFTISDFQKYIRHFGFLIDKVTKYSPSQDFALNRKAAYMMAALHDRMDSLGYEGHELRVYLVRLLFCLFAEDTGVFGKDAFYDYIQNSKMDGSDLGARLSDLFEILDKSPEQRTKQSWLSQELLQFQYINGGLFCEKLSKSHFDADMRQTLLRCCDSDWSQIKPEIFGALFQGVMDKEKRHELGAHYTSEENILKVIRPLFLDDLKTEFNECKKSVKLLQKFYDKLPTLKFFDPSCGCGNFLIVAYRELRMLEIEVLKVMRDQNQMVLDVSHICRVNVDQFYGIEIEEFPSQIAIVGMWLCDHLMNERAGRIFNGVYPRLPLKESAKIVCGNALRIDWNEIVPNTDTHYVFGNPPYLGSYLQDSEQKKDMDIIFKQRSGCGDLDYVSAWYQKAAEYIQGTNIEVAFVSTNSITQGQQVQPLWQLLIENLGIVINFAYRTFVWKNAAKGEAKVHCVIIGFDTKGRKSEKWIVDENNTQVIAHNINPYLIDANNFFIKKREHPICDVPEMQKGNIPVDGGNFILTKAEYEEFLQNEPQAMKFIKPLLGAKEFLHNQERWCLWLIGAEPSELAKCPMILNRIQKVKEFRLASPKKQTQVYAKYPTQFMEIRQPTTQYILVPRHSSEKRAYIPIGFVNPNIISTDANSFIPNATLYHFGVLTSNIHMAWMRAVCGRLEMRYRYSNTIVYNNFVWPEPTLVQKKAIGDAAQKVLDARAQHPDSPLETLYGSLMPPELLKAHEMLDKEVERAYGRKFKSENEIVTYLMEAYMEKVATM